MNELLTTLRGVMALDQATFERFGESRNVMRNGVLILLVIFLVAGSLGFVFDLVDSLKPFTATEAADFREEFLQGFRQFEAFMPQDDEFQAMFMDQFLSNFEAGLKIGVEVEALDRPLPRSVGKFFEALGRWISSPLGHLGSWLAYAIWVLLFAKLLGGAGDIKRFLGLTALYSVPNLLSFFEPVPFVGGLIAFIGAIWGLAVYVRGVQISQRFDVGKAILATVLPILTLAMLAAILALIVVVVAVAGGG